MKATGWLSVCLSLIVCRPVAVHCQTAYVLTGTIVTPQHVIDDGYISIKDGIIKEVGPRGALPVGTPTVDVEGVIFPGLIDLHNHLVWNVFPRWAPPSVVGNRYEWQALTDYSKKLSGPEKALVGKFGCDMERYAEIKALLGGATSVVGSLPPGADDPQRNACDQGLARNLDFASGLYSTQINQEPLRYEVFPFEIPWSQAQAIRDGLASRQIKTFLIHVSEGKDASAAREFKMLEASGFLRPGVSVIHGVALGPADFREMAANGVGLIWSPHSNFALYGTTTDIAAAKDAQVTIALAPDWSPSGSSGVLEEIKYARRWDAQGGRVFSDSDFVYMATVNAAKLAALSDRIGSLAPGMAADLIVLPRQGGSALSALLDAPPAGIRLVAVAGQPLLGDPDLMSKLLPGKPLEEMVVCKRTKALYLRDDIPQGDSWKGIETRLTNAMQALQVSLAPLSECN